MIYVCVIQLYVKRCPYLTTMPPMTIIKSQNSIPNFKLKISKT